MKKIVATYDHVVVPGEIDETSSKVNLQPTQEEEHSPASSKSSSSKPGPKSPEKKSKKGGKDEDSGETIAKRAEMMAEDPYLTSFDKEGADGGSKEKQKKVDKGEESESDGEEKSPDETRRDEAKEAKKDLDILVSRADKILLQAHGIFPFDFFPDTLTIDANKVNIIIKTFFATETATSVLIKEIMDVRVESSLFFGKLIIDYGPHPLKVSTVYIPTLHKKDALKAKEIIEGMLVVYRGENIDTTRLKPEDTLDEIKQIGKIEERE